MKTLLLMRHAKSSWADPGVEDHDRVLNARGLRAAPLMGERLLAAGYVPDRILVSTAARARQTANLVAAALDCGDRIDVSRQLYLAEADDILKRVRQTPPDVKTLLVVGHNPGMEELASYLAGSLQPFPTAAVAVFRQAGKDWSAFGDDKRPALVATLRPKDGD
ncbi:MAG: histidine phosphatase family protein [Candidatus Competibacteraceae bacterium]|nr:histidine phosphatase family protein [Candidatus Competibacteraceae bacterium]